MRHGYLDRIVIPVSERKSGLDVDDPREQIVDPIDRMKRTFDSGLLSQLDRSIGGFQLFRVKINP